VTDVVCPLASVVSELLPIDTDAPVTGFCETFRALTEIVKLM
jgi:hypothetical protein